MVYNRRSGQGSRRRGALKKDNTLARTKKDANQDKRLERVERNVKELKLRPELKFFDTYIATLTITSLSAGYLHHCTAIGQGITTAQRIGDEINAKSIYVKYNLTTPEGEQDPAWVRVMIVCDNQSNGFGPTFLTSVSNNGILDDTVVAAPYLAFYNDTASMRYKVYYDKVHMIRQIGTRNFNAETGEQEAASNMPVQGEVFVKLGRKIKYGSGVATFPLTNAFYVVLTSDQPGVDEAPRAHIATRLSYTDE